MSLVGVRVCAALLAAALCGAPCSAQLARLVGEIETAPFDSPDIGMATIRPFGARMIVEAKTRNGRLLYGVDAASGRVEPLPRQTQDFLGRSLGGLVYVQPAANGAFATDGTRSGTQLLTENLGSVRVLAGMSAQLDNGTIISRAIRSTEGDEVLVTDGTSQGTLMFDLVPGADGAAVSLIDGDGERVFFVGRRPNGHTLWTTDGTAAGTSIAYTSNERIINLAVAGGFAYFVRNSGGSRELWVSDGTPSGTQLLTPLLFYRDHFFLAKSDVGVVFDGDLEATNRFDATPHYIEATPTGVMRVSSGPVGSLPQTPVAESFQQGWAYALRREGNQTDVMLSSGTEQRIVGTFRQIGRLVALKEGLAILTSQSELFVSNGSQGSTRKVADDVEVLQRVSGKAFFLTRGEVWETQGTAETTRRRTRALSFPLRFDVPDPQFAERDGTLFFAGSDLEHGIEPWSVGNDPEQARLVADLVREGEGSGYTKLGGSHRVIFAQVGNALWAQEEGSSLERVLDGATCPSLNLVAVAGNRALVLCQNQRVRAVGLDGPSESLPLPLEVHFRQQFPTPSATKMPVLAPDGLWVTDGTAAGTYEVFSLPSGQSSHSSNPQIRDGVAFFWGNAADEASLYRIDLATEVTTEVARFDERPFSLEGPVVEVGDTTYFDRGGVHFVDSSSKLPVPVNVPGISILEMAAAPDRLLVLARDSEEKLFSVGRSDVQRLLEDSPGNRNAQLLELPQGVVVLNWRSKVFFTDGTTEGTRELRLEPGQVGSHLPPTSPVAYFSATTHLTGSELWRTDGTQDGTRLVHDLNPGPPSSSPTVHLMLNRLILHANDGLRGQELFEARLDGFVCQPHVASLCMDDRRFRVDVDWRDFQGGSGRGKQVPLTDDTGAFWFFDPENLEVLVKILDGRGVNGFHWIFGGALTNVPYALTAVDSWTGESRRYLNPSGNFGSFGDTSAFGGLARGRPSGALRVVPAVRARAKEEQVSAQRACTSSSARLCLAGSRFEVRARWRTTQGTSGDGVAVPVTEDSGYFWFFDSENVELMVKVLDGRSLNGNFWVFYGALSDVEFEIEVTDSATGKQRVYRNPQGTFASVGDPEAF